MYLNDINFFFPELFLFVSNTFLLLYGTFQTLSFEKFEKTFIFSISYLCIYILCIAIILLIIQPLVTVEIFLNYILINFIKQFFRILLVIFSIFLFFMFFNYFNFEKKFNFEYAIIIMYSLLGMLIIIDSNDFILFFLSLEFQSFCLYILASIKTNQRKSTEAGLKYFILGSFSSGLLLFGISIIYFFTGLTNFYDLYCFNFFSNNFSSQISINLGFIFVLIGIFFKFPAVPFHNWAPDVYQGAPTIITVFFALIPKIALTSIIIQLVYFVFPNFLFTSSFLFSFAGFFSIFFGSLGAFFQTNVKRLLAYSTISHVGFIFLGFSTVSIEGLQASLFYIFVYLLVSLNFFFVFLMIRSVNEKKIEKLSDLFYFSTSNKFFGIFIAISFFSLAGIPPLAGFFSKFIVLLTLTKFNMYFFAFFSLILTVLSCFYYIRIVRFLYFDTISSAVFFDYKQKFNFNFMFFVLFLITFINVFFVFMFDYVFQFLNVIIYNSF
jgi:NADH-quinone oxidoreductase subunit N